MFAVGAAGFGGTVVAGALAGMPAGGVMGFDVGVGVSVGVGALTGAAADWGAKFSEIILGPIAATGAAFATFMPSIG